MEGFQLWANLPASHKMMDPRYREVKSADVPEVTLADGGKIRVICGKVGDVEGPVRDVVIEPEYLDITIPAKSEYVHPTRRGHNVFAYVIGGRGLFCHEDNPYSYEIEGANYFDLKRDRFAGNLDLILFGDGDRVVVTTQDQPVRFLLISGKPIGEPIAWGGPIVMNTQQELRTAFEQYRNGTFIKQPRG
jgi:redox-sensitive bicupin YhaK (pirin superfamily)